MALLAALALAAGACGGDDEGAEGGEGTDQGAADDGPVSLLTAFTGEDETGFNAALAQFEEETGIEVEHTGTPDFDTNIVIQQEGGNPPDVAIFPQPGLLIDFAERDQLVPLSEVEPLDLDQLRENLIPGFLGAGTTGDQVYGLPMRMAVKSVVWHPAPEYEEAGYPIPQDFPAFRDLIDTIREDGETPLALGIEAGTGTGWVLTDWIEEMVLRYAGPELYDQWVAHEIPFNHPEILEAAQVFEDIMFTEGNMVSDPPGTLFIPVTDAPTDLVADPPQAWLHRQGNFALSFFPEDVQENPSEHLGVYRLPGNVPDGYEGSPVLGGGDLAARFATDNPAADQLMRWLAQPASLEPWAAAGGYLSPLVNFDPAVYPNEITRDLAEIATGADVLRFDASDLMPGQVGTGAFWTEMVEWINGEVTLEQALQNIEDAWPTEEG